MKNHKVILLSLAAAGVLAVAAPAAMASVTMATGPYLSVSAGLVRHGPSSSTINSTISIPLGTAIRPAIGYRFNQYVAVEAGYDYMPFGSGCNFVEDIASDSSVHCNLTIQGGDAAVLLGAPVGNFNFYLKGGAAYLNVHDTLTQTELGTLDDTSESAIVPELGAGVAYNFTKHFSLGVEGTYFFHRKNMPDLEMVGVRLGYTF